MEPNAVKLLGLTNEKLSRRQLREAKVDNAKQAAYTAERKRVMKSLGRANGKFKRSQTPWV